MAVPIWKDLEATVTAGTTFNIRLTDTSGTIIYTGKAAAASGTTAKVRINDICADYIANNLPRFGETFGGTFCVTFCVEQSSANRLTASFYWDWSYDYDFDGSNGISAPIRKEVPANLLLPVSWYTSDSFTIKRTGYSDSAGAGKTPSDFNTLVAGSGAENELLAALVTAPAFTRAISSGAAETEISVNDEETIYKAVTSCAKYAIYYLNAFGGWDVLAIEGAARFSEAFTRTSSKRSYLNTDRRAVGTIVAANELTRKFTFHTGWVDDAGAQRMVHLLGTTNAFLYDIEAETLTPLVITNGTYEKKTRRADGMLDYTIEAEVAQSFVRR